MMKKTTYQTAELAARAGVNKETLRFYERKGLLTASGRTSSGYRQFSEADLDRVLFIKSAKELGFSLSEIRELLSIADGDIVNCSDVRRISEAKLSFVQQQVKQLKKLEDVLSDLIKRCKGSDTIGACPIIESLSKGSAHDED